LGYSRENCDKRHPGTFLDILVGNVKSFMKEMKEVSEEK
jgi:hypothetical protein